MEPLPVDNQFVVISLCLGILTLHLEVLGEEELGEVLLWFRSVYHNDSRRWQQRRRGPKEYGFIFLI